MDKWVIVFLIIEYRSCTAVSIVSSPDQPCPGGETCLTLQEYALNPVFDDSSRKIITLDLLSGQHLLESRINMKRFTSLTMRGMTNDVTVICRRDSTQNSTFFFSEVQLIDIYDVNFEGCTIFIEIVATTAVRRSSFINARDRVAIGMNNKRQSRLIYSNLLVAECRFYRNTENIAAGLVSNVTVKKSVFESNRGAAVAINHCVNATIRDSYIHNNIHNNRGTVLMTGGGEMTVTNTNFSYNIPSQSGGGIYVANGRLTVVNCVFSHNIARIDAGAVYILQGELTVTNCTFYNNTSIRYGGAVVTHTSGLTTIVNSVFDYNRAGSFGGAIYILQSTVVVSHANFSYNIASESGGAIAVNSSARHPTARMISLTNTSFTKNRAMNSGGGAIYFGGNYSSFIMVDSDFNTNSAAHCGVLEFKKFHHPNVNLTRNTFTFNLALGQLEIHGGGVICIRNASALLSSNYFVNNTAIGNAGVLKVEESSVVVEKSTFRSNRANGSGGVFHVSHCLNCTFTQSTFIDNQSGRNGGVMYVHGRGVTITNTNFSGNIVLRSYGGAIYAYNGELIVTNSIFSNNTANSRGGAIYTNSSELTASNSVFINNRAGLNGGAILASLQGSIIIDNTDFTGNSASDGLGGAIAIEYSTGYPIALGSLTNSTFTDNTADGGGAMYIRNASILLSGNYFTNNSVTGDAGVLRIEGSDIVLERSTFSNNSAGANGGVFFTLFYPINYTIIQSTFIYNHAGSQGGVLFVGARESQVAIDDQNMFTFNHAAVRGGIFATVWTTLNFSGPAISENTAPLGEVGSDCYSRATVTNPEVRKLRDPFYSFCNLYDIFLSSSYAETTSPLSTAPETSSTARASSMTTSMTRIPTTTIKRLTTTTSPLTAEVITDATTISTEEVTTRTRIVSESSTSTTPTTPIMEVTTATSDTFPLRSSESPLLRTDLVLDDNTSTSDSRNTMMSTLSSSKLSSDLLSHDDLLSSAAFIIAFGSLSSALIIMVIILVIYFHITRGHKRQLKDTPTF